MVHIGALVIKEDKLAQRYTARDLVGVLGIVPTPATPDAGRWDASSTVNVDVTTSMIRAVAPVVDAIITLGTFGEGATLTEDEVVTFMKTVVSESGTTPTFAGATTLNTRDTIRRARMLLDIGVDGLFLGRPMWCEMDDDSIVRFYSDIADALPDVPVILYDNPAAFKGKISSELYARLAAIPTLIGAKYTSLGSQYADDVQACGDEIRLLPMDADWLDARRAAGQHVAACWTPSAACGTEPLERLREAMASSDWDAADAISRDLKRAYSTLMPDGDFSQFSKYNIPLDKARIAAAGVTDPGPARPPYQTAPQAYLDGAIETGRRWAELQRSYTTRAKASSAS
ncbi:dihydrodipicolinate synthase family protein [Gryllotalpicola sp.]|uniref:dihydrodipicolinate synthase family protein n=1 Tax=Gryllotalpicola sp. TaxID=1932787 RepID=UPI002624C69B|nr:dihydrodipicolinate synthase family protein [Gryllotalpicola sp.]